MSYRFPWWGCLLIGLLCAPLAAQEVPDLLQPPAAEASQSSPVDDTPEFLQEVPPATASSSGIYDDDDWKSKVEESLRWLYANRMTEERVRAIVREELERVDIPQVFRGPDGTAGLPKVGDKRVKEGLLQTCIQVDKRPDGEVIGWWMPPSPSYVQAQMKAQSPVVAYTPPPTFVPYAPPPGTTYHSNGTVTSCDMATGDCTTVMVSGPSQQPARSGLFGRLFGRR